MNFQTSAGTAPDEGRRLRREAVVIRFAGDSGDGIQSAGNQFGIEAALAGNDLSTYPDYPSEIRAPAGTTYGVSSFQIQIASQEIHTPGDKLDCLVAFNPAALKVHLVDLKPGGVLIVDAGAFKAAGLKKAGYDHDPLSEDHADELADYRLLNVDISTLTRETVAAIPDIDVSSKKDALKARNMWVLGLVLWLYGRDKHATLEWIDKKFGTKPLVRAVNFAAVEAGYAFGATALLPSGLEPVTIEPAKAAPGLYRTATGAETTAYGLAAGALKQGLLPVYCSYPITPATTMLHTLARLGEEAGIRTFQAEDEIAAICAAIGASYAGGLGMTGTSGPGMALKSEGFGLAVAAELPLVIVNVQRGGPSTGLPTKVEQSDLLQAVAGRHGDAPMPVIAMRAPSEGFDIAVEAARIAVKYMTPVIVLSDGYIANAAEPWKIPSLTDLPDRRLQRGDAHGIQPFARDPQTLARPWIVPGMAGGVHRLGGLERQDGSGEVSYDPKNHERMTELRMKKIDGIAEDIPLQEVDLGAETGDIAVLGWGSTYGAITDAVEKLVAEGLSVSHIHLRYIHPFPRNLPELLKGFKKVIVPELNTGQLTMLLRAKTLLPIEAVTKVAGRPFQIGEVETAIRAALSEMSS
ncbi:2-oxoglutarate ferredoxin oxidoreductase subunit alpha [Rhodobium orientis]|uniref:2-oxoglutarate ferredoxin oxidoreductase subunit alpha n=1 Tax=Rhodobium orientis TaxID=34017 RepID=A0A327JGS9_9HYPH|nr:2-oxoacid:acceptor oxidoreductase subunit alpha [Rhodobium orientis]MBB4304463.1 2-oxoglutarate ferredoxin oxidoreductase subunit alpha [Rhodobium orientis]MBK5949988.1 2-oxoglutarate ferredoxin oxidoreductase subunit alpha [Rhodobium orientis]RAI25610.1 2-oxoglutarate ferredoxin oxidoreductase subunit alpha [Rhodobium orientis]